jgi:hypothetical protein
MWLLVAVNFWLWGRMELQLLAMTALGGHLQRLAPQLFLASAGVQHTANFM